MSVVGGVGVGGSGAAELSMLDEQTYLTQTNWWNAENAGESKNTQREGTTQWETCLLPLVQVHLCPPPPTTEHSHNHTLSQCDCSQSLHPSQEPT